MPGKTFKYTIFILIFREVVSNLLIHREFANPFPAKLVIENDRVFTENSNKPHGNVIRN